MLDDAIRYYIARKGLRPAALVGGLRSPHASSVSRVIRGITQDPHTTTLVHVCRLVDPDPTSLLARAGMWTQDSNDAEEASASADRRRADALCDRVLALPEELRETLWDQVDGLIRPLESAARRRRPSRRATTGP